MGPVRGKTRKRKRGDKKKKNELNKNGFTTNNNTCSSASLDWWHDFSRLLNGGCSNFGFLLLLRGSDSLDM
ncbi:hypothetical protein LINPERHAP2_LOCUS17531 [Linum perenne]